MKFTFQPEARPLEGFTIKRAIDRGGFGEVYYALSDSGKEVALKLLQHNMEIELRGVSQCLNLKHPNLVTIFDIRTDRDGDHWVVMEFVAGRDLEKVLADHPHGLPMEQVQRWIKGIAEGLSFLHDRGIVHRDVKPGNIFMDNGTVKLGDVGLSKFVTPSRRSAHTESVGTVYYMAPEVARGRYGREVDVYSLAVILYEMLTGRVPFDGESTGEILMKHLSEAPNLDPLPPRLRPVLAAALEKDPHRRTPSVAQLADDFAKALRGEPVATAIPPRPFVQEASHTSPWPPRLALPSVRDVLQSLERRPWYVAALAAAFVSMKFSFLPSGVPKTRFHIVPAVMAVGVVYLCMRMALKAVRLVSFVSGRGLRVPQVPYARSQPAAAWSPVATVVPPTVLPPRPAPVVHRPPPWNPKLLTPLTPRRINRRQQLSDLSGSMSCAAVLTVVFSAVTSYLTPLFGGPSLGDQGHWIGDPGKAGLFALTTLLSAWGILLVSKLTEGKEVDLNWRRLLFLGLGVLVGTCAYGLDLALMVDLDDSTLGTHSLFRNVGRQPLLTEGWQPSWLGYALFFGALFGLRRWWWHADTFRPKAFRVSSLLLTIALGFLLPMVCAFPQTWAVSWAAAISCVVQLSAVWIPQRLRPAIMEGEIHA